MSDAERLDYERTIEELRADRERWRTIAENLACDLSRSQRGDLLGVNDILWSALNQVVFTDACVD